VLERLQERGVTVYRTDLDGAVMVDATKQSMGVRAYRGRAVEFEIARGH
jgi:beta-lactamase superfamily II metal-dependent hydrolase